MANNCNFHALFNNPTNSAFIKQLDIDDKHERELDSAVDKIKSTLRPNLRALAIQAGVESRYATPLFRPQGSKVYKTQNEPAHTPQQQVDVDLGVYLSANFFETVSRSNGTTVNMPAKALAKLYFETVDELLKKLCKEQGWKFVDGEQKKKTCCRIDLSPKGVNAHIDVPLYAAPDDQFENLIKAEAVNFSMTMDEALARSDLGSQIDEEGWPELEFVVMARRDGVWTESDVQVVIKHFKDGAAATEHPFIIRRIWRYIKAWRDFNWRDGGSPSSVLLMETVLRTLDVSDAYVRKLLDDGRDDQLLFFVFAGLKEQFLDDVIVNWGSEPEALNTASIEVRKQWTKTAAQCEENFDRCFNEDKLSPSQVIALVREQFGQRISNDTDLVKKRLAVAAIVAVPRQRETPQARIHSTQGA